MSIRATLRGACAVLAVGAALVSAAAANPAAPSSETARQVSAAGAPVRGVLTASLEADTAEKKATVLEAAVESREAFDAALTAYEDATAGADGVDLDGPHGAVLDAQEAVLDAEVPSDVEAQTQAVLDATQQAEDLIREHDAQVEAKRQQEEAAQAAEAERASSAVEITVTIPPRSENTTEQAPAPEQAQAEAPAQAAPQPATDWQGWARGQLNAIGGGWVSLEYGPGLGCGAAACAFGTTIQVDANQFPDMRPSRKTWVLMHEYAHSIQFQHWDQIMGSATYQQMFGSNIELLANCMASARGETDHGHYCSPEMISWAGGVWSGVIN